MIGAGVFTTSGYSMGDLHSPAWVVAAWAVAGLIAIAGAISYGRLIRVVPESGGEYLFLSRAYHPFFGFVAGWVSMFAGFTAAIAFAALTFETYASGDKGVEALGLPRGSLAISIIIIAAFLHGIRVRIGAGAQNLVVVLKLILLLSFLVYGALALRPASIVNEMEPVTGWNLALAFCRQLMWISLSYMGFNAAVYIADEVPEARQVIPRALVLGTVIVVALYVLLNAVFVYSADASSVAESGPTVAAMAAERLGGSSYRTLFTVIVCIALFTSVTSMMMAAPRVYAKMADEGMLPRFFRFHHEAPVYAILLQTVLATAIILNSTLNELLGYLGITLSICAAASVSSLFLPRFRKDHPLGIVGTIASVFYVSATVIAVVMTFFYRKEGGARSIYAALITFGIGAALYLVRKAFVRRESSR